MCALCSAWGINVENDLLICQNLDTLLNSAKDLIKNEFCPRELCLLKCYAKCRHVRRSLQQIKCPIEKTFNHCICISSAWVHTTQQNFKYLMQFNWIHLDLLTFCFPTLPPLIPPSIAPFFPSNLIAGFSRIWYFLIAFIEFARFHPSLCFLPNRIWSNLALTISPLPHTIPLSFHPSFPCIQLFD